MSKRTQWEDLEEKKEILKEKLKDCLEEEKSKMDRKAEFLVLERRKQMERVEREMEDTIEKLKDNLTVARDKLEQDKKLAAEMSRLKREDVREKKIREQLRDSNEELKVLESKLRAAHVSKLLMAQIAEKEEKVVQEKLEKIKIQNMIEAEKRCMEEETRLRENTLLAMKQKYRDDLLNQIKEGNKKDQDKLRDLKLEKVLLEQAMRKIREEDEREKNTRLEKVRQMKKDIEEFEKQKEIRKQNEKRSKEEEERIIKEYVEEKDRQEKLRIKELKEKEEEKNKIREHITALHLSKLSSTKEREEILAELAEEEIRQKYLKKNEGETDVARKVKEECLSFLNNYLEEKNSAWNVAFEEQERYRNTMLEAIAQQEKLDRSSAGNKAVRTKELQTALLNQMKEKHRLQVEEWQRESAQEKLREAEERDRMRIVEEERLRMLRNHAVNLIGYLPRGTLHENDIKHLGPDFLSKLDKHNAMNKA